MEMNKCHISRLKAGNQIRDAWKYFWKLHILLVVVILALLLLVGVSVMFVCDAMLSGSISSNSPAMFTWRPAALKSKDKNRELCAHLSHCFQMEGGRFFCSSSPLMWSECCACVWCGLVRVYLHLGPPPPDLSCNDIVSSACCEASISCFLSAVRLKDFSIASLFLEGFVLFCELICDGNWTSGWLIYG